MTDGDFRSTATSRLPKSTDELIVYVMSDSSGETASHVTQAVLVQFRTGTVRLHRLARVRSIADILAVVKEVTGYRALIAYTLVLKEFREALSAAATEHGVATVDLLGPLMGRVAELSGGTPLSQVGRLHLLDEAYYKRMDAVNFAVQNDDGSASGRIPEADVLLLGVSRTSKTPNCMYLAQHYGLKAANVPLVLDVELPRAIYEVPRHRLIGLTVDPHILHGLRTTRARIMGMGAGTNYTELETIKREVAHARAIFRELGCHIIDVSNKAIEETSSEIALLVRENPH